MVPSTLLGALALSAFAYAVPLDKSVQSHNFKASTTIADGNPTTDAKAAPFCFPSLGFIPPLVLPSDNTNWWCDPTTEYAFLGFSYEVTACELLRGLAASCFLILPKQVKAGRSCRRNSRIFATISIVVMCACTALAIGMASSK